MEMKKEKVLNIFLVIINLIVVIKLLKDSFKIEEFQYLFMGLLIGTGVILYLFFSEILKGKKRKFIFFVLIVVFAGVFTYKTSGELVISATNIIYENVLKISSAALDRREIGFEAFKEIFAIIIPLIVALSSWITRKWSKFPILFSTSVYIGFWYLIFYEKVISNMPFFIAVFVASMGISEYIKRCKEYSGRELKINISDKTVIITILILTLVLPVMVRILPQEFKGTTINGILTSLKNQFSEPEVSDVDYISQAVRSRFSMRQSGYSDSNTSLGGPISINKRKVFTVKADKPYYLRSRVKDNYSGSAWTATNEKITEQVENPIKRQGGIEYLYQALSSYEGYTDIKAVENSIVITPGRNFKSGSCFTPNGAIKIEQVEDRVYYNNIPTFMSNNYIREPYLIKFVSYGDYDNYLRGIENEESMKLNLSEEYTLPMREYGQADIDYYDYLDSLVNTTDPEELKKYNKFKWTYINYMQVPDTVREEVYDLVKMILLDEAESKGVGEIEWLTTHEKALAIRNYLKKNYQYKTNVKNISSEVDFVSNFLLDEKEGYCTYFASANAIMCRIAGVPARYSEGFKMSEKMNPDGEYVVTNEEAHAWTEVLVNPYRDMWAISDASATPREELIAAEEEEAQEEETTVVDKPQVEKPEQPEADKAKENKSTKIITKIGFLVISVLTAIVLFIFMLVLSFYIRKRRILNSKSVIPLYNYCLNRLKTIGIVKNDTQGDLEFVKGIYDEELRGRMKNLALEVYNEFYGGNTSNNINKLDYLDYVEAYVKGVNIGYKYVVNKYFFTNGGY